MQFHSFLYFKFSFIFLVIPSWWVFFFRQNGLVSPSPSLIVLFLFFLVSSLPMSVTTRLIFFLHPNYFAEISYCRHISTFFFVSPSPLLIFIFWSFSVIHTHRLLQLLIWIADYVGNVFPEQSYSLHMSYLFFSQNNGVVSPSLPLIVIFEVFYDSSLLLTETTCSDGWLHWKLLCWAIKSSPFIKIVFLPAQWSRFAVTVVDCYILRFLCRSSSQISATATLGFCLPWNYLAKRSYYHHTS